MSAPSAANLVTRRGRAGASRLDITMDRHKVILERYCSEGRELMEATSEGWSERRSVVGHGLKFGLLIQRVRIPPGQSVDPQVGSEPCSGTGNCPVDA